jgi:hypothetical protein
MFVVDTPQAAGNVPKKIQTKFATFFFFLVSGSIHFFFKISAQTPNFTGAEKDCVSGEWRLTSGDERRIAH